MYGYRILALVASQCTADCEGRDESETRSETSASLKQQPQANARSVPRSGYPPITAECLPNWTRHFNNIRQRLGHAPNARPLGKGMHFLPGSVVEFRVVQRYLTEAMEQESSILLSLT
ncbi:unnamed protein product [Euphydryas editha]|uniref:Uncharacterized protein n=1 Tax=Euphydryas editha TaxID=104508 RepID=A0AAU9UW01_EUPED|nr:unnamed protein product [Euphydryas editha]